MDNIKPNEKQVNSLGRAGLISSVITVIYLLLSITSKYWITRDIIYCTSEILLFIIIGIVFTLCIRKEKENAIPKTVLGKSLPTDRNAKSLIKRIASYARNSILFALMYMLVMFTFEGTENIFYLLAEGVGLFFISFIMDFIIGERRCRKYNKKEASQKEDSQKEELD